MTHLLKVLFDVASRGPYLVLLFDVLGFEQHES